MLGPRTLRRYVAKRFLMAILGAFTVCAVLIFMIDMVELLRHVAPRRRHFHATLAVDGAAAAAGVHGDPAGVRRAGGRHRRPAQPQPQVRAHRHARGRHVGVAVPAPWPGGRLVLGIFAVTVYNPLAAAARSEAERRVAEAFGREASLLAATGEESWLRQDGADGQSVMSARAVANQGLSLTGVIVYQFDPQGRFVERIDADKRQPRRRLLGVAEGVVSRPGREPETFDTYTVSTYLTRGARRRGAGLGDRGLALAAALVDRSS